MKRLTYGKGRKDTPPPPVHTIGGYTLDEVNKVTSSDHHVVPKVPVGRNNGFRYKKPEGRPNMDLKEYMAKELHLCSDSKLPHYWLFVDRDGKTRWECQKCGQIRKGNAYGMQVESELTGLNEYGRSVAGPHRIETRSSKEVQIEDSNHGNVVDDPVEEYVATEQKTRKHRRKIA